MLYLFQRSQANSAQKPWEMNNYWKYGFFYSKIWILCETEEWKWKGIDKTNEMNLCKKVFVW